MSVWKAAGFAALMLFAAPPVQAVEETLRGVLERTARPAACAQITDALGQTFFILKTELAERRTEPYVGKNVTVRITGVAESREGDRAVYFNLRSIEPDRGKAGKALPEPDQRSP